MNGNNKNSNWYKNKKSYTAKFNKRSYKVKCLSLSKTYDTDIIEHLAKIPNVQGYIKSLIRSDMSEDASK